jgi:hypothetical protein
MCPTVFSGDIIIAHAGFRQHDAWAKRLRIAIGRHVFAHDVFAEARAFIDAEHTGNTACHCADRAANGSTDRTGRRTTRSRATFRAADHALRIRSKRERGCKRRRSKQKFKSHVSLRH